MTPRAASAAPGADARGEEWDAPVALPLGGGAWRGPAPRDDAEARACAAAGWRAEEPLPGGAWRWRAGAPAGPAPADAPAPVRRLERARAACDRPFPPRPRWLAILNLTPDSFSDGGALLRPDGAADVPAVLARARALLARGAEALDLGAESTRPGAAETPEEAQLARLLPAVRALAPLGIPLSVDTRSARVAAACLDAGAAWINDVSGLEHDPAMAPLAARRGCPTVLTHMRGSPADMRGRASYADLLGEVADELAAKVRRALDAGMNREQIVLDPGIGFAKDAAQSGALVARVGALRALGLPLLAGPSRKSFLAGVAASPRARDAASAGAAALCAAQGVEWLRLHDGAAWDAVAAAAACARAARGEEA